MIKGIAKIKGLGVYDNYSKPSGTQEFGIKNLIYGWNYSGKTTLSRLFSLLEAKNPNPDMSGCEFSFETDNQQITDKNFGQSGLTVRVFNSDFVRENLHFEGSNFKPILLLGKESDKALKRIVRIKARIDSADVTRKLLISEQSEIGQTISNAKTEKAKTIRQLLKIDPYTATQLGSDMLIMGGLESKLLVEKEFTESLELALTPESKKPGTVDRISASPLIQTLHKEAIAALAATPSFSNTIKHLDEHPEIERWIETGLLLHTKEGNCEFCGNTVTEARLAAVSSHFSKDLKEHKQKIEHLLARIKVAEISLALPKPAEFNPQYRADYELVAALLPKGIQTFNKAIRTLADDVQCKVDSPRKPMEPTPLTDGISKAVTDQIEAINIVIDENNKLAENFATAKADAIKKVRYHHVQEFIDSQKNAGYENKKESLIKKCDRLQAFSARLEIAVERLQALISQAQLGREMINERLVSMLGGSAVQIVVVNDISTGQEHFKLVRKNGKTAKNLSDGERTAIAFSYFLTKLQELKPDEFENTIVYIDDPISSLDANHIFQVTAAIRALFFKKENDAWKTTCKQIFISTHSFEFFNLLREIRPNDLKKSPLFLIKRINENVSTICDMPKSLARYQSEYHFLFHVIYRFYQAPDKTDHEILMLLPNAMRRFVELYTYSRLPGDKNETVDQRAEILFGAEKSKRILKVFHYFSHANTIDRLVGNSELIFDIENAVKDLFEAITDTDKKHMDSLIASI
jgi:wobble nucleotide-excising tRNase